MLNLFFTYLFNKKNLNYNNQLDLDFFSDLCQLNISIFNKNFNNLHISSNTTLKKTLYFLNKDNKLYILIKDTNKGLIIKNSNNIFKPKHYGGNNLSELTLLNAEITQEFEKIKKNEYPFNIIPDIKGGNINSNS